MEKGEKYFYEFLKPLADVTNLTEADFIDWGNADNYVKAVGIGECAGVVIDLVATLLLEAKEKLTSEEMKYYKINKLKIIQEEFKNVNVTLIEDEVDVERYTNKKKQPKETKKSTVQETYELWLEKNSIKEIATIRKFTPETILGHLTKLIISQTISINDVLPEDKILDLTEAFKGYKEESISPLKEKYGDKFSWEELRMFKASLNL